MFSPLTVKCCVCGKDMDWMQRHGLVASCCSKECYDEFEWRQTLAILGKPYRPQEGNPGAQSSTATKVR